MKIFIGTDHAGYVLKEALVKVMGWYDNEMGYTYTLVDHVIKTGGTIK